MTQPNEKLFDKRLIERAIQKGEIKRSDYEKYLKNLPDDSKFAMEVVIEEPALPSSN